jgi:type IV pilus assembly protein PilX
MITHIPGTRTEQRGIVLVSSLLLLLVVTIIALSMFRSFGIQEKIAGNMREKQRALQAAVSAQQYAEWWLSNYGAGTPSGVCAGLANANTNVNNVGICSNQLPTVVTDVTNVPWLISSAPVGVTFTPPGMPISSLTTSATNTIINPTYFSAPIFYISDMGASVDASMPGEIYQIDAAGYGGNSNTVAEVESTYVVYTSSANKTI